MTVIKIGEGAFFVPPYYSKIINSHVPGLVNQGLSLDDPDHEDEIMGELTMEVYKDLLKKIARPLVGEHEEKDK